MYNKKHANHPQDETINNPRHSGKAKNKDEPNMYFMEKIRKFNLSLHYY